MNGSTLNPTPGQVTDYSGQLPSTAPIHGGRPEVQIELDMLSESLSRLEQGLVELSEKLKPVLAPVPEESVANDPMEHKTPLAREMHNQVQRIRLMIVGVDQTIRAVEV